jgi:hypothetical protein
MDYNSKLSRIFTLCYILFAVQVVGQLAAPSPPSWVKYDSVNNQINVQWLSKAAAVTYDLMHTDEAGTTTSSSVYAAAGLIDDVIACPSGATGESYDVFLRYTDTTGLVSDNSPAITMLCAGPPASPSNPTLLLSSLDLILISWDPPASDGGSPILGYSLMMKTSAETTFVMAYNGTQDPTTRQLAITSHNDKPLEVVVYEMTL